MSKPLVVVFIPAYNEEGTIGDVITNIAQGDRIMFNVRLADLGNSDVNAGLKNGTLLSRRLAGRGS